MKGPVRGTRIAAGRAKGALGDELSVTGWGLAIETATQIVGMMFTGNAVGAAAIQAVITEWGAGRLGISWSDPTRPIPSGREIAHRALLGGAVGLSAAMFLVGSVVVTRGAAFHPNSPSVATLLSGLILPGLVAVREELLFRGLVLRLVRNSASGGAALAVCGVLAIAARFGGGAMSIPEAAVSGFSGVAFAALWQRDRGAWLPWGAHVAWLWGTAPLINGGLFDVRSAAGRWGGGLDAGLLGGYAGAAATGCIAVAAIVWARSECGNDGS